jgi:hypothetical protein
MGQAKQRRESGFADDQIRTWEQRDCVDFALALSRKTGWLLHVDWMVEASRGRDESVTERDMVPLRVYVGDDKQTVYDVRGPKSIHEFNGSIIQRLAKDVVRTNPGNWRTVGVSTKAYSEEQLNKLPLRAMPDEELIQHALGVIEQIPAFLNLVPPRPFPRLPPKIAFDFAFGACVVYAAAYEELTGHIAASLCVDELLPGWEGTDVKDDGFVHSLIPDSEEYGEDSWGRQPISSIAKRFGAKRWHLSREVHEQAVIAMKRNTPARWVTMFEEAKAAIKRYALQQAG